MVGFVPGWRAGRLHLHRAKTQVARRRALQSLDFSSPESARLGRGRLPGTDRKKKVKNTCMRPRSPPSIVGPCVLHRRSSPQSRTSHAHTQVMSSILPPMWYRPACFALSPKGVLALRSSDLWKAAFAMAMAILAGSVA